MISRTFSVLFYIRKRRLDANGECPIYMRMTVDGLSASISTQLSCDPVYWNQATGKIIIKKNQSPEQGRALNTYLDTLKAKAFEAKHRLIEAGKPVTAEAVKNMLQGRTPKGERPHFLIEIFQYHNDQVKALLGREYSKGTLTKFETVLRHMKVFLKWKYSLDDIDIRRLDYEFITELEFWFKSVQHVDHNTTMKYIACIKKLVIRCIRNGWLQKDPFLGFSLALREKERQALTQEEVNRMIEKFFPSERLALVRDIFLFSCYTGLSYADIQKLKRTEINTGIDGAKWVFTKRQKTDTNSRIPLLPQALDILARYEKHPQCVTNVKALPILSNQKMNAYLKEIAECCGIHKYLTFHLARHTFATTITLSNGVPIETVSKMLGHRNLKTTQHYAKILDSKVSEDMAVLKEKLSNKAITPISKANS